MVRISGLVIVGVMALGCANKPPAHVEAPHTTAAVLPRGNVNLSEEIMRLCKVHFDSTDAAPKFDFDEAALMPNDRIALQQVAKCVTEGPLKGRHLDLIGRADPRGETEYNMALGENRADAVHDYLIHLGMATGNLTQTSRGEIDAEGTDEDSWARDRRVDLHLAK